MCIENEMMTWEQAEVQARKSFDEVGGIDGLAKDIESLKEDIEPDFKDPSDPDGVPYIDIRLNYQPEEEGFGEDWDVKTGDSQYDQDHRGFWGCGAVTKDTDAKGLAVDLLDEVLEHYASSR